MTQVPDPPVVLRLAHSIAEIDAASWDACAGTGNPFLHHDFLSILEESGSVGRATGWLPRHVVLEDEAGAVQGCVPLYLKSHSYGEYVFDHGWAQAYENAGGRYYPKMQVAVPFTPVPGPRLLVRPGCEAASVEAALIEGLARIAATLDIATVHVTFPNEAQWRRLGAAGWLQRIGCQFHWHNAGYGSFDDFLGALSSRKRKSIRKERREVQQAGIAMEVLTGAALRPEHWDAFFGFYRNTSDRKWGHPYLTRRFFHLLGERMADRVALVLARAGETPVAGALNLIGEDALYGRNWGCDEQYPFLHFEACYYQAIEFAIARGLARVEAGAQGEHKIQRGYLPVRTYSAHLIRDPGLSRAVAEFLRRETAAVEQDMALLAEASPFRRDGEAG